MKIDVCVCRINITLDVDHAGQILKQGPQTLHQ